jgi:sugar phosphate isomerase/epimerase
MTRSLLLFLLAAGLTVAGSVRAALPAAGNFSRINLVAWCIVPFDSQKRGPEERAAMLDRLGIKRLAYDWRAEHIPSFDTEVATMRQHGIEITAWWFPAAVNDEAKAILACIERNKIHPQLWVTMGTEPEPDAAKLAAKIDGAVNTLKPICEAAAKLGCTVALYNHLGWFGEPTNQVAIIAKLRAAGHTNVGIVYNFHHAHAHLDTFAEQLRVMRPHLLVLNLNGMVRDGDKVGKKIIPLGTGDQELRMLQILNASGWRGPVGIIGHTDEDAEVKLKKELEGLDKLVPLVGQAPSSAGALETGPPKKAAGEPAISGREPGSQAEKDWVDNRWQQTDVGPFLASNLRLPDGSVIAKALAIRVGEHGEGAVVYDTETCTLRAAWTGGFLKFDAGRFGLIGAPSPAATPHILSLAGTASLTAKTRFLGIRTHAGRVLLNYEVDGAKVLEFPGLVQHGGHYFFTRAFEIAAETKPARLPLGTFDAAGGGTNVLFRISPDMTSESPIGPERKGFGLQRSDGAKVLFGMIGNELPYVELKSLTPEFKPPTEVIASWLSSRRTLLLKVAVSVGLAPEQNALTDFVKVAELPQTLTPPILPGPSHWPILTTHGQRGPDTDFLAVDTLTLPYDNPAKALLFASGIDFTPDGAGYLCTIHGDVWRVTGIDDSLRELRWQRYATGLFQPLGLKVRDGKVFVLGRDRITRLHDGNGDGEADFYENFCDGIATSTGGHDYVTCLETDSAGNFYYTDPKGLHRIAADGSRQETLATGFRNPNGMGVRPDGKVLTAAPQQGNWTPSSGIWEVRGDNVGLYGGYGGPKVTAARPLGYDAPLCWIPHAVDNSSGSQVWVPPGQWGPLGGQMLHLLWGRCGMMLVMRDEVGGAAGEGVPSTATGGGAGATMAVNGAVVPLPVKFLSGPNRATYNPKDGALYVAGSTGWQTSAVNDGALQRVRYTNRTPSLPVRWAVKPGGLEVTFTRRIDPRTGNDPGSYSFKQWNYRYAEQYGSKDWSVADPQKAGRDELTIKSARVDRGGRVVFLEIPDLKPVMQFELKYNVDGETGGKPMRGSFWGSINRIP